jgi:hypothetical protein
MHVMSVVLAEQIEMGIEEHWDLNTHGSKIKI